MAKPISCEICNDTMMVNPIPSEKHSQRFMGDGGTDDYGNYNGYGHRFPRRIPCPSCNSVQMEIIEVRGKK